MTIPVKYAAVERVDIGGGCSDRIIGVTVEVTPVCSACGRELDAEQIAAAPQFFTDALCMTCHQWLGRALVGWLGPDPTVAQLPDDPVKPW